MLAPLLMSTKHVVIRKYKGNYDAVTQSIDSFIPEYFVLSCITWFLLQHPSYEFTWTSFAIGTFAGILMSIGRILIAIAISEGIAAAA